MKKYIKEMLIKPSNYCAALSGKYENEENNGKVKMIQGRSSRPSTSNF